MKMEDRLRKIAKYLQAGIVPRELIGRTIRYSIEKSKETPGEFNPESLTVSKQFSAKHYPKLHLICAKISGQLGSAMAGKFAGDGIKRAGDEIALQVDLWIEETRQQIKPTLTDDELKYQKAINLFLGTDMTWREITEEVGENPDDWRSFQAAVKRFADRTNQEMPPRKAGSKRKK